MHACAIQAFKQQTWKGGYTCKLRNKLHRYRKIKHSRERTDTSCKGAALLKIYSVLSLFTWTLIHQKQTHTYTWAHFLYEVLQDLRAFYTFLVWIYKDMVSSEQWEKSCFITMEYFLSRFLKERSFYQSPSCYKFVLTFCLALMAFITRLPQ